MDKPLQGVKVLDLTRLLPGPMCSLHLADMGADVIKIEDPIQGDYARWMGVTKPQQSGYFIAVNRNKRGLVLDLRTKAGQEIFLKLAKEADVILESFRPRVVDKLGIDYASIKAINPRIVYCAITGYGQTGPYAELAGHDLNYCGYAGVSDQIGRQGQAPVLSNFQIADLAGGALSAAMGICAALFSAHKTGQGRYIDVSMTDCTLAHSVISLSRYLSDGETLPRGEDLLSGGVPCYGIYPTADNKFMAVGALEYKFWALFCDTINKPELKAQHLATGEENEAVQAQLVTLFTAHPQSYWIDKFSGVDCCVTPILRLEDSENDPHLQARNMFIRAEHPTEGETLQFAFPIKFSDFEFSIDRHAPSVGEHSKEILLQLGYDEATIEGFAKDKVI